MTILLSIALFTVAVAFKPFGTRFGSSFKASKPSPRSVTTADVAKPMFKDGSRLKLFQGSGDIVADAVSHDAQFGPGTSLFDCTGVAFPCLLLSCILTRCQLCIHRSHSVCPA